MAVLNAKPWSIDRAAQTRNALLGKVHIAKKQLKLSDDDYRSIVFRHCGAFSSAEASETELNAIVEEMKSKGFKPLPRIGGKRSNAGRAADHPSARKARAMWISLYQLGAIDNPSEAALEAFARRQVKTEKLQWANQSHVYKLIEALKAMGERDGWGQSVEGLKKAAVPLALKRRLVTAIHARLVEKNVVPADWTLDETVFRLTGTEIEHGVLFLSIEQAEAIARDLGAKLREHG